MSAQPKEAEDGMTVAEFLVWAEQRSGRWQLVDGRPVAMAPANRTHGALQNELGRLIGNALVENGAPCSVVADPGVVPRVLAHKNVRVPDLAVVCSGYVAEQATLSEPVVAIEILSPGDQSQTWSNVWTYTTIPTMQEIAVFETKTIGAKLLRRLPDGGWPEEPQTIASGDFVLKSVNVRFPVAAAYRTTRLSAVGAGG